MAGEDVAELTPHLRWRTRSPDRIWQQSQQRTAKVSTYSQMHVIPRDPADVLSPLMLTELAVV